MFKKIPCLLLALAISTLVTTVPNSSFAESRAMWTIDEMATLKAEIDAEDDLICIGDWECEERLFFERLDSGNEIYRALDEFNMSDLIISSINPSTETISLYFQDKDQMMKMMGIDSSRSLSEVYMFWLEDGMIGPAKDTIDIYNYSKDVKDGNNIDGLHPLISKNEDRDGVNWLPPKTEVYYSVVGSNLMDNEEGIIYFTVNASGFIIGLKDYSTCIKSPDYVEGMECRLMFSGSGPVYVPSFVDSADSSIEDPVIEPVSDLMPDSTADGFGSATLIGQTSSSTDLPITGLSFVADESIDEEPTSLKINYDTSAELKAPETGSYTYPAEVCNREVNIPWWLIAIILVGNMLFVWWFMPKSQKNRRKHHL